MLVQPRRWAPGPVRAGAGLASPSSAAASRPRGVLLLPPARATQQQQQQHETLAQRPRTEHLRVLRYPNGDERVIRYPAYAPEDGGTAARVVAPASTASAAAPPPPQATAPPPSSASSPRAAPAAGSADSGTSGGGGGGGSSSSSGIASASLDDYLSWDVTGLWSSSTARPQAPASPPPADVAPPAETEAAAAPPSSSAEAQNTNPTEPLSDADYLESLFAAAYAPQQQQHQQQPPLAPRGTSSRPSTTTPPPSESPPASLPAGTYQVLTGCPWPMPRPLYTLALRGSASAAAAALASRLRQKDQDAEDHQDAAADDDRVGSTYTLSVRTRDRAAADDLARALGKAPDWAARMDVGERRDGVVAFASERDARRYARLLERPATAEEPGGGHSGVAVAQVDSHALFRATADVKSVVVYLPPCGGGGAFEGTEAGDGSDGSGTDGGGGGGGTVPRPHQLAAALLRE